MTWDEMAAGWDDEPAVRTYAAAAFDSLTRLEREGRVGWAGRRVLDFGCGTGLLSTRLAERAAEVVAADASAPMVAVLEAKVAAGRLENLRPVVAAVPPDGPFELVTASSVLAFVPDYPAMVRALVERLAPGGALVQWDWALNPEDAEPYGLTPDQIRDALSAAGLQDVHVDVGFDVAFEDQRMRPLLGYGRR